MLFDFDNPLQEGLILKRSNRFIMEVKLDENIVQCHCPTTGRIGDIVLNNIPCLLSLSNNDRRKLKYTVEAIALDALDEKNKNWVGINQIFSNKLVKKALELHKFDKMLDDYKRINPEVILGQSRIDFLVNDTFIEVKTPLTTIDVIYSDGIITKQPSNFASTERFVKHLEELTKILTPNKKAILLIVKQYETTFKRPFQKSTQFAKVSNTIKNALEKNLKIWEANFKFTPNGVRLISYGDISQSIMNYIPN